MNKSYYFFSQLIYNVKKTVKVVVQENIIKQNLLARKK
jgi:hypothetical protein